MYTEPLYIPKGWQCPVCKRVYAPDYPWCIFCGQDTYNTTDAVTVTTLDKKNETILKTSGSLHFWTNTKTEED